jgi:hypothetical protein
MRPRLEIRLGADGTPKAEVQSSYLWELVEHLSCQRVAVLYRYEGKSFIVSFPRLNLGAAQQTLDEWTQAAAEIAA